MTMLPTKPTTNQVVTALSKGLAGLKATDLPTIRSIYPSGSYVRGDWLNASSDLDVQILFRDTLSPSDLARIKDSEFTDKVVCSLQTKEQTSLYAKRCFGFV